MNFQSCYHATIIHFSIESFVSKEHYSLLEAAIFDGGRHPSCQIDVTFSENLMQLGMSWIECQRNVTHCNIVWCQDLMLSRLDDKEVANNNGILCCRYDSILSHVLYLCSCWSVLLRIQDLSCGLLDILTFLDIAVFSLEHFNLIFFESFYCLSQCPAAGLTTNCFQHLH